MPAFTAHDSSQSCCLHYCRFLIQACSQRIIFKFSSERFPIAASIPTHCHPLWGRYAIHGSH
ncbi:unnamed protein product, partial [Staurois parvus]